MYYFYKGKYELFVGDAQSEIKRDATDKTQGEIQPLVLIPNDFTYVSRLEYVAGSLILQRLIDKKIVIPYTDEEYNQQFSNKKESTTNTTEAVRESVLNESQKEPRVGTDIDLKLAELTDTVAKLTQVVGYMVTSSNKPKRKSNGKRK